MRKKEKIQESSGNIFADIRVANPERVRIRAEIMLSVTKIIRDRHLTQTQAAEILGIHQSKVSCLMNGKLSMFSFDHLLQFLNALGEDVSIFINPKKDEEKVGARKVFEGGGIFVERRLPTVWRNFRRPKVFSFKNRISSMQPIMKVVTSNYSDIRFKKVVVSEEIQLTPNFV